MTTQTKQTHTPGPWQQNGTHIRHQKNPGGYRFDIAEVFRDVGIQTAEANTRLIAAAPELLSSCEQLLSDLLESHQSEIESDHYGDGPTCGYCETIKAAQSAISKARGEV